MQHVQQDAGVRAINLAHDASGLDQTRCLRPRDKLKTDIEIEWLGHVTQRPEPVNRAAFFGIGQLGQDVPGSEFSAGFEKRLIVQVIT
ncbi:hypothetical protein XH98_12880 [Bradyrhizobium sp. CCBAU 51745]|nr:hypothetical protein [Bradyrhizobium sp. CCBAU 51745]